MVGQKRKRLIKKSSEHDNETQGGVDAGDDEDLNAVPSKRKRTLDDDEID